MSTFSLGFLDWLAIAGFFTGLSLVGWLSGRKERDTAEDYFLAGRRLPWYVVGGSYIASNISTEHFIGMIGAAFIYGTCVAVSEWANVFSFTLIIWFFIPFLMASRVFTMPEFLERRFNGTLRQFFALVTLISNIVAFLAAVLYGGGLALQTLFGWPLWAAIILLGVFSGLWAMYGGLASVAWTDFFTVIVMVLGGLTVSYLGLQMLAGDSGSIIAGFSAMLEANQAKTGVWKEAVAMHAQTIAGSPGYNRLSVIQPVAHKLWPWPSIFFATFSLSIWYHVLNQFMIQRVLAAKDNYHARMGMVFAGMLKVLMPAIVVLPGLILFAKYPEVLLQPWDKVQPEADRGYVRMLQTLVPMGLRGLFLAALFGAIQSTVNSVLNSSATIITLDFYKRLVAPEATQRQLVRLGIVATGVVLAVSMVLAGFVGKFGSLFVYIQSLYAFFAPPFAAVFLMGILFRRVNAAGATAAVFLGFALGIALKLYIQYVPEHPAWLAPYLNQAIVNWLFCVVVCAVVSAFTAPPRPEQVTPDLMINWRIIGVGEQLGTRWYDHVVTWWLVFVVCILSLAAMFSGLVFPLESAG
ncbi:MAG: sodium/solute symporter [Candidatus Hydrogenedentes bacterium]|nr:sodium/solute symporter [Candidatus Hydrogenedentota bacterium]